MSRVFVRALAMELKWLAALLLALSLASRVQVITGEMENDKIKSPIDWICITTAGGIDVAGGAVNLSLQGSPCSKHSESTVWIGYLGAVIAIVLFGSNFVPVKKYDTGDGLFFQWMLCIGIWLVGLAVNMFRYQPPFFYPTLLGGALWTTGNLMVVPIIKTIGLTMGLTVWGVTNMLSGWFSGMFILKQRESLACSPLNYGGVATVVISVIVLAFVKSEGKAVTRKPSDNGHLSNESTGLLSDQTDSLEGSLRNRVLQKEKAASIQSSADRLTFSPTTGQGCPSPEEEDADFSWVDRLGVWPKRAIGFALSLISGIFYGLLFLPIQFMKLCNDDSHSSSDIDYLFGMYSGILIASTFYFGLYSACKLNRPRVYPRVILPGLVSGIMWGIAMLGWFLANQHLSLGISFPIVTAGPGFVSSAWGIFVFREIKGWFNRSLYFVAFTISLCGLVMDGLSRCTVTC